MFLNGTFVSERCTYIRVRVVSPPPPLYLCAGKLCLRSSGGGTHTEWRSCRGSSIKTVSTLVLRRESFTPTRVRFQPARPPAVSPDHPRGSGSLRPPAPPNNNWRAVGWILSMFAGRIPLIETSPRGVGERRDGADPHVPSVGLSIRPYHVFCYYISIAYWKTKKGLKIQFEFSKTNLSVNILSFI